MKIKTTIVTSKSSRALKDIVLKFRLYLGTLRQNLKGIFDSNNENCESVLIYSEEDEELIGLCCLVKSWEDIWFLTTAYIIPEYQNKGIFTKLDKELLTPKYDWVIEGAVSKTMAHYWSKYKYKQLKKRFNMSSKDTN